MQPNDSPIQETASKDASGQDLPDSDRSEPPDLTNLTPVEALQKRYADQLSQDIERLEEQKSQLREDIQTLTRAYMRLQASVESLREAERSASKAADEAKRRAAAAAENTEKESPAADVEAEFVRPSLVPSPRLPGEPLEPKQDEVVATDQATAARDSRLLELPIPATSAQRRQLSVQSRHVSRANRSAAERKGLILSAIATLLMAWHFCVIATLGAGGSWLGVPIGALGTGFLRAVALLWLRMIVVVPALVLLAPQLHEEVWNDLRDWTYKRDGLLLLLIGSGVALFLSQALLYQCLGLAGAAVGAALLFLYPLSAVPLNIVMSGDRPLSALSGLALVAIAMGGVLTLKPDLQLTPSAIWLGLAASIAFSLYVALTHLSYRQPNCHPIPASLVQFGVVAALSSIVLLVKPLEPVGIEWLSFTLWGLLLGLLMLLVYLFNYSSLRLIGPRTAVVTAFAPIATLLVAWSFVPTPALATIQWTGIVLVSIGGVALGKETLAREKINKEKLGSQ